MSDPASGAAPMAAPTTAAPMAAPTTAAPMAAPTTAAPMAAPPTTGWRATQAPAVTRVRWRQRSRLVRAWRLWNTRRPVTFTDKVRYKMLRDRRQLVVTFADKDAVRDHVASTIGAEYLPVAYAITTQPQELLAADLPESFVMKPTHGSGAAVVVSERAAAETTLPTDEGSWVYRHVRPEAADRAQLVRLAEGWVEQLYGQGPNREWVYGEMPRQVIVEELLVGADGGIPDDYKFFVFHGRAHYVQVDAGRFDRRTHDFFDIHWNHLPVSGGPPWAEPTPPPPTGFAHMVALAERLGADTDFVRVDLYHLGDRVVFGELTNYPAGGDSPFNPESFNALFGTHWTVPKRYR
jgi:hypothetical protein